MNSHDFLDSVCGEIKYKSVHESVKQELNSHIEDGMEYYMEKGFSKSDAMHFAVSHMGDSHEIGRMLDREYRLPFNSRFGLGVWAAIVTVIVYTVYPFLYSLYTGGVIKSPYVDFLILGVIFAFMALNVLYLRSGRKVINPFDMGQITVGFLLGYAFAASLLTIFSKLTGNSEYYVYMPEVGLPFSPPYIPFLPIKVNIFALQGFSWWFCIIAYVVSVKSKGKNSMVVWNWASGISNYNGAAIFSQEELAGETDNKRAQ